MSHDMESPVLTGGPAPVPPPAPPAETLAPKRLLRSRRDRVFGGVCGGLGDYFGVDAVLVRIVAVALALSGGVGFLVYVIAWIAIPEEGTVDVPAASYGSPPATSPARARATAATIAGVVLVAVGAVTLLNRIVPWVDASLVWPSIVVAAGVAILLSGRRRA